MAKNDKYTDPELRNEIKADIQAGDKGGNPGQWSARKAQMMAAQYKQEMHKRGEEPYTTDKSEKSEPQNHLSNWTDEEWQTSDGKAKAKQDDGSMKRYLPKKAWEEMSEDEKRETDEKKLREGDRKQYVNNTDKAKKARKHASKLNKDDGIETKEVDVEECSTHSKRGDGESKEAAAIDGVDLTKADKEASDAQNGESENENIDIEEAVLSEGSDADDDADLEADGDSQRAAKVMKTNGGTKRVTRSTAIAEDKKRKPTSSKKLKSASKEAPVQSKPEDYSTPAPKN